MRWEDFRQSENIEDRRGDGDGGGGGMGLPIPGGGGGLGIGAVIVLTLIGWALGINPAILIGGAEMVTGGRSPSQQQQAQPSRPSAPPTDQVGVFVAKIVGNTEDVWTEILPQQKNVRFTPAPLVLFDGIAPGAALKASFSACLKNVIAFTLYAIVLVVLFIVATIPFGLGLIVVVPVALISVYTAYREIFFDA